MSGELLPCPRCGGEMSVYRADGYTWDVMCNGPDCIDEKVFTTREDAIAAANRRTTGPATAKLVEACRAVSAKYQALYNDMDTEYAAFFTAMGGEVGAIRDALAEFEPAKPEAT